MTEQRKPSHAAVGLIMGTAIGFGLGMILYVSIGEPLYLLVGAIGTALGLVFGAAVDRSRRAR
jgi:hypothetical protein